MYISFDILLIIPIIIWATVSSTFGLVNSIRALIAEYKRES